MGSYTEVVLQLTFLPNTPEHVLAAFSALATSLPDDAPPLPAPHQVDETVDWEPTDEVSDPLSDPQPWLHDWSAWLSSSMTVSTTPHAQLTWSRTQRWVLSCRWGIKSWPESILPALQWLGPHLEGFDQRPIVLGYMQYGGDARPALVWLYRGRITLELLTPEDERM
ncbi:hypothetical protein [Cellulomonas xylanilytica]|uniref:Uncharacterized protein n=1 Tax=Cellulomonas xylanilytica TaxID=233583 RepID=A0A510V1W9_9CELL|nr:hypothetical protein [Cellulomonas xylanilytica]GEK20859.1 hypothetical protein CXY01_13790 [Cellulomonas xylanilytica]